MHVTLGIPHDCNKEVCNLSLEQIRSSMPPQRLGVLKRSLLNAGVDPMGGRNCIVSATHTEQDIDQTVAAYEQALSAMRDEGSI